MLRTRLLVVALLAALIAVPAADASAAPRLTLVSRTPLVVRGVAFRPSERVVVTALTLTGPRRAVVRATSAGRFAVTFRLPAQPCGRAFAVRAVGAKGSAATLTVRTGACVPPPID